MGAFRSNPYVKQINDKITKVDTDQTYTFSPLEKALDNQAVAIFSWLKKLSSGGKTNIYIINQNSSVAKFIMFIDTTDQGEIHVYHDPDVDTSSATQLQPQSVVVGASPSVSIDVYANVTNNSTTPNIKRVIPGGSGRQADGNTSTGLPGMGILPGHSVLIEVENTSSNANTVSLMLIYWEG